VRVQQAGVLVVEVGHGAAECGVLLVGEHLLLRARHQVRGVQPVHVALLDLAGPLAVAQQVPGADDGVAAPGAALEPVAVLQQPRHGLLDDVLDVDVGAP
jgi:hypothetical protein